jgi:hypothetical protein
VYRLVTGEPQRIPSRTFAALCDIFDCTPNDLFEPYVEMQAAALANAPQSRKLGVTPGNPVAKRIRIVQDLTAIANTVVNDRARQLGLNMSSDMNQADRERFWDLTTAEDTTTDQQPVPELFTAENLRFHLFAAAVAAVHRFDLELHVANVDPDDLLRVIGARFNYWTDDVAHDPIFDWN